LWFLAVLSGIDLVLSTVNLICGWIEECALTVWLFGRCGQWGDGAVAKEGVALKAEQG